MKNYTLLTLILLSGSLMILSCDNKSDLKPTCQTITLQETFTARIGEQWCIPSTGWSITFGPFIEDSRCNVPNLECFWEGRFVLGATINNGESTPDTFNVHFGSQDTLYNAPYTITMLNVKPEFRATMEPWIPPLYSFDLMIE